MYFSNLAGLGAWTVTEYISQTPQLNIINIINIINKSIKSSISVSQGRGNFGVSTIFLNHNSRLKPTLVKAQFS